MASVADSYNTFSFIPSPGPLQYYVNKNDKRTNSAHLEFNACCNDTYLKNFSKLNYSAWYRIVILIQNVVSIKDFLLHSVSFVSNNPLPPEANALRLMLIRMLRSVDHKDTVHAAGRGPKRICLA